MPYYQYTQIAVVANIPCRTGRALITILALYLDRITYTSIVLKVNPVIVYLTCGIKRGLIGMFLLIYYWGDSTF